MPSPIEIIAKVKRMEAVAHKLRENMVPISYVQKPSWRRLARAEQLPPSGVWTHWLILAGRGFGKTRAGAEWVLEQAAANPTARIALVGRTAADVRAVMVDGESGILACAPPNDRPEYLPSVRRLAWKNGAIAETYSAEQPDQLRGPQHTHAWCDEIAAWAKRDAYDQLQMGLRLGKSPKCLITTTPRPSPLIRELTTQSTTAVTRGSTYQNRANLPDAFFRQIIARYEGSRLGRQELNGEILEDTPGALWSRDRIEELRLANAPSSDQLKRIVVAIDPSGGDTPEHDEQGIIVAAAGLDGHYYVLFDASGHYTPEGWGKVVCGALESFGADRIVAETNYGGAMVESVLRTIKPNAPIRTVTASRGKYVRAEPVAALYEQGRVHHVGQYLELEDELCTWTPQSARSPNRLDALVWALTDLAIDSNATRLASASFAGQVQKRILGSTSRRW